MGIFKKEKTWYIDYYVNGKRKREAVGPSRRLAEKALAKRKVQIAEKRYFNIKEKPTTTFDELIDKYMKYARANKISWDRDANSIKRLLSFLGNIKLSDITPLKIEEYKQHRLCKVCNATVNRELACLKHMFNKAIQWTMAESNPVREVKMFKERNERKRYLDDDEVARLMECLSERIKPIVVVALCTGMRKSEILNLKKEDIDFNQRLIFIKNSKNGKPRDIPMSEPAYKALKSCSSQSNSQYVFTDENGQRVVNIRTGFNNALKRAGIDNFRFHDLRHTFASHLVMKGNDLLTVKELLGHQTINMTLRYAHLSQSHRRNAVDLLWTNL